MRFPVVLWENPKRTTGETGGERGGGVEVEKDRNRKREIMTGIEREGEKRKERDAEIKERKTRK